MVGSGGVGKSAFTIQFTQKEFSSAYDPTVEDSYRKQVEVDYTHCVLDILDTAGQEEYSAARDSYMRSGQGFICMYSITSHQTLREAKEFRNHIARIKGPEQFAMVLVGNKCDLDFERQVPTEEGEASAQGYECPFFEASAKSGQNVDEAFFELVRQIIKMNPQKKKPAVTVNGNGKQKKGKSGCYLL